MILKRKISFFYDTWLRHYDTLTLRNVTYGDYETHLRCYEDENEDYNLNDNRDNSEERQPRTDCL